MIDSYHRPFFQNAVLEPLATGFARLGIKPNQLSYAAILSGMLCGALLAFGIVWPAVVTLLLSGLLDATDGTLARKLNMSTDAGCILDITGDRVVEASIVLGLFLYEPTTRAWPALLLISSFYLCVTTFLLSGIFERNYSHKSFHYSPGLVERGETFIFFLIVMIWDATFQLAAVIFSGLVALTAFIRFIEMMHRFSSHTGALKKDEE